MRWPGVIKPGEVINEIGSLTDFLPTFAAAAGEPDIVAKLKKGHKLGDTTFKVHIDGYNLLPFLAGKEKCPRDGFIYWSDDGDLMALRMHQYKMVFAEQLATGLQVWREPLKQMRIPKLFDLRSDPFEAGEDSIRYNDWFVEHVPYQYAAQAVVHEWLSSFTEFPPRQKSASFSIDQIVEKLMPNKTRDQGSGKEADAAGFEIVNGADQLHDALPRALTGFRRFQHLAHRPAHVGFDGGIEQLWRRTACGRRSRAPGRCSRAATQFDRDARRRAPCVASAAVTAPQPLCPITTKSGVCRCMPAYCSVPMISAEMTLPATRTMNSSPKPASKTSSGGTRESLQPRMVAYGCWPLARSARISFCTVGKRASPRTNRSLPSIEARERLVSGHRARPRDRFRLRPARRGMRACGSRAAAGLQVSAPCCRRGSRCSAAT